MENKKEMTIPNVSAATDAEQSDGLFIAFRVRYTTAKNFTRNRAVMT